MNDQLRDTFVAIQSYDWFCAEMELHRRFEADVTELGREVEDDQADVSTEKCKTDGIVSMRYLGV